MAYTSVLCALYVGILVLSPEVAYLCFGEQFILTCSTNEMFLRWGIAISQRSDTRLVSSIGTAREVEPLVFNSTTFYISRTSDDAALPLISTLLIDNVTNSINRTVVNCSEITEDGETRTLATSIHIIGIGVVGCITWQQLYTFV